MAETDKERPGPIATLLAEDHRRLDGLLCSSAATADQIDQTTYDQFRAGLLRHIGMEEKLLLPAVQRWRGGAPLPVAAKLRLDHGALATLLMPTPTPQILATIRRILSDHNPLEEGPEDSTPSATSCRPTRWNRCWLPCRPRRFRSSCGIPTARRS
ncbi:MAG: hemerythrin domain-containing protein [Nitrospira sp.]|nr:hemerythrin domain-containing protein [Nitrospira sp.]